MPSIPYPAVPDYPGVPMLARVDAAVASSPSLAIGLGTLEGILGSALQQAPRWGIFDSSGNQLGADTVAASGFLANVGAALLSQLTGMTPPILSTFCFDYMKETRISDFPVEGGGFADYNKVEMPANPVVTLALAGSESDRANFLNAIDAACKSTGLYMINTPEVVYVDYSVERYRYQRRAERGATLLLVEVSFKEIREVSATYAMVTPTPITNPQDPAATAQVNAGTQQATPLPTSTLKTAMNKVGIN